MIAFPILAAVISLAFGTHLLVRSGRRRSWYEGTWAISMLMYSVASATLASGILGGWTAAEFRIYWLFGAVLTVPYLAQGEIYLLVRNRWVAHGLLVVLLVGTAWAASVVRTAPVSEALAREFPLGREVFGDGSEAHRFAQYYSFPAYFLLLGGAVWSAFRIRGREELRNRFLGTLLVAAGATVVAVGSGIGAGFHNFALFSVSLAAGVAVMYWGFLVAARRTPVTSPPQRDPSS